MNIKGERNMPNEIYYGQFKDVIICLLDYSTEDSECLFDIYVDVVVNKIRPAIKTMFTEGLIVGYYFSRLDDAYIMLRLSSNTWSKDIKRIKKILNNNRLPSKLEDNEEYISEIDAHTYEVICSLFIYFLQEGYQDIDENIRKKTDMWTFMLHNIFGVSDMEHSFKSIYRSISTMNVARATEGISRNQSMKMYLLYIKILIKELIATFLKRGGR